MTQYQSLINFVPRHPYTPDNLCHDAKNRAMLRSFRLVPGQSPDAETLLQPSLDSAPQTHFIAGPLGDNAGDSESRKRGDFSGLSLRIKVEIGAATPGKEE